jgi:DNA-binding IscR family transcriptional regulator
MISSRFTVAVHILTFIHIYEGKVTSEFIASSVNTNAAVIRKLMSMLGKAKLIESRPGVVGIRLMRPISEITLLEAYHAVELPEARGLFTVHQGTSLKCPVGRNVQRALDEPLRSAQLQMENALAQTTVGQVVADILDRENDEAEERLMI